MLFTANAYGQNSITVSDQQYVTRIQGTELSRLPYAIDILRQMPKLLVDNDIITVVGRGVPDIYVDNRKITELSELSLIPAAKVKSVKVISQPGAEYDKTVQAVIVITLVKDIIDGFKLNETFRLDLTHKLSANNELSLGWKNKALSVNALFAFNEERRTFTKTNFKYHYQNFELQKKDESVQTPDIYKQRWTGHLNAAYAFNDNHSLSVRYQLMNLSQNRTYTPQTSQTNKTPETRHDISVQYGGKLGVWNLVVGNDMFFNKISQRGVKPTQVNYYLRDEFDNRAYARATAPLWKGSLTFGAEHEYDHMDVDKYEDDGKGNENGLEYFREHAKHPDHTLAVFASTSQTFGKWTIEAGVRYEHQYSKYQPCENDGLMTVLNKIRPYTKPEDLGENEIVKLLFQDGHLAGSSDYFYPTLRVMTKLGASDLTLAHTQSSVKPYLGHTRLGIKDYGHLEERILWTEKVATTSLSWKYHWAELTGTFTRYRDAICTTMDGSVTYNAPDYNALDFNATFSPNICGVWTPVLNINMHKQWFDMELANGKDKLYHILFNVNLNNRIVLPHNWLILVGAKWHSKGGMRNYYYYKPDFNLNASIQKEFPRQRLTFILSANNILKTSYNDVTRYTQAFRQISEGMREEQVRMVSLTAQFKL